MAEYSRELFALLEKGAHLYVCGDAQCMPGDVNTTLQRIVAGEGGMTDDQASDYLKRLKSEKQYLRDVY